MESIYTVDFLIIGQGLAGSLLAWNLLEAGQRVLVIDNQDPASASRVAAGLVNPVTGLRLVKHPNAERYLNAAQRLYSQFEQHFGQRFYHHTPMLRLFNREQLKSAWQKRCLDPAYQAFIDSEIKSAAAAGDSDPGYDGFFQRQTGYLRVNALLTFIKQWLQRASAYLDSEFDYAQIQFEPVLRWRNIEPKKIIFCEGARIRNNPWFNDLPMQPAAGEILTLHTTQPLPPWIINAGKWLLPLTGGRFKLGATYQWPTPGQPFQARITAQGKQDLLNALGELLPSLRDFSLLNHQAGIRPSTRDRHPLIGLHRRHPELAVFNGFGSKGSLLIPYYAQHFSEVLVHGAPLDAQAGLQRVSSP